jgi:hypothetical protein
MGNLRSRRKTRRDKRRKHDKMWRNSLPVVALEFTNNVYYLYSESYDRDLVINGMCGVPYSG